MISSAAPASAPIRPSPARADSCSSCLLIHGLDPADWTWYVAPFDSVGAPLTAWPSDSTLSLFIRITPGTPQQGLDRIREMFGVG